MAVVELAVALGREGKAWPGTGLCSQPAASRVEATQGRMERVGRREGLMPWSDGKAACPAGSKRGDAVLSPWDVPNPMLSGGLCPVALPVEGRTGSCCFLRNSLVSWSLHPWPQAAAFSSWSCKGTCPAWHPVGLHTRGISVCPSVRPCSAVGLCNEGV